MSARILNVRGRSVAVAEQGAGAPLVYLHGFADVHAAPEDFQPFHARLAHVAHVVAPAHPGCSGSGELHDGYGIDDILFHYLEVFDALRLERFDLVGHCVGGWFAAEFAVRYPERVKSLTLIGACGLFVEGAPIGDVFMHAQPERGVDYKSLRRLLFNDPDVPVAKIWFPDGRADLDVETRRYQMLRFASFVGFRPPYFYNRSLRARLYRASMPALALWGEADRMTSRAHGEAYGQGLGGSGGAQFVGGAGHAAVLEAPEATADLVLAFLGGRSR